MPGPPFSSRKMNLNFTGHRLEDVRLQPHQFAVLLVHPCPPAEILHYPPLRRLLACTPASARARRRSRAARRWFAARHAEVVDRRQFVDHRLLGSVFVSLSAQVRLAGVLPSRSRRGGPFPHLLLVLGVALRQIVLRDAVDADQAAVGQFRLERRMDVVHAMLRLHDTAGPVVGVAGFLFGERVAGCATGRCCAVASSTRRGTVGVSGSGGSWACARPAIASAIATAVGRERHNMRAILD